MHTVDTRKSLDCLRPSSTSPKSKFQPLLKEKELHVNLFRTRGSHALEALLVRLMHLGNLELVFLELVNQLSSIELAIASASLNDLGLLIKCEVLPGEVRTDVFLEQG